MGVSIVRFNTTEQHACWGVLRGQEVYPLDVSSDHHKDVMALFYDNRQQFDNAISTTPLAADQIEFLAPLSRKIQLFAQGLNYVDHRTEGGYAEKSTEDANSSEENLLFMKASSTISKPNVTILRPRDTKLLDYEIELGVVLRKNVHASTTVTDENLHEYIGGLILCNDVSSRDLMFGAPAMQWYKGKSQRTFCPAGPILYLLHPEDFDKLYDLQLRLKLNGRVMQDAVTSQLIHKPPKTISEISEYCDLNIGDCILTGTPGGVLTQLTPKAALAILLNMRNDKKRREKFTKAQLANSKFLQPGDVLELEIVSSDGTLNLGKQRNEIAQA